MLLRLTLLATSLAAFLPICNAAAGEPAAKRLLLLGQSPDGHPQSTHEYLPGMRVIQALLTDVPGLQVEVVNADEPWAEGPARLKRADGVVLFLSEGARWLSADPRRQQAFAALASRGAGVSALHWGMGTKAAEPIDAFLRVAGGCHGGPDRRFKVVQSEVRPGEHPVAAGIEPFRLKEEFYFKLKFATTGKLVPVLQADIEDRWETVSWAWERPDGGRSFGFSGLHFHENWRHESYRRLVAQGVLWSLKMEFPAKGLDVDIDENLLKLE